MILTLIGLAALGGAGYAVYKTYIRPESNVNKIGRFQAEIEQVVATNSQKIEAAVAAEVQTLEAVARTAFNRVEELIGLHPSVPSTQLAVAREHLSNAVNAVTDAGKSS